VVDVVTVEVAVITAAWEMVAVDVIVVVGCKYAEQNVLAPADRVLHHWMSSPEQRLRQQIYLRIHKIAEDIIFVTNWTSQHFKSHDSKRWEDVPARFATLSARPRSRRPGWPGKTPLAGIRPAKAGLAASKTEARAKEAFMMKMEYRYSRMG
jgi:hypothetical protein